MLKFLEKVFKSEDTGARVIQLGNNSYIVRDSPIWDDSMARIITRAIPNVELSVKSDARSLSGFAVLVQVPMFYHNYFWLLLAAACFVILGYLVNECWIHYLSTG